MRLYKNEQAEQNICPVMSKGAKEMHCISDRCMVWTIGHTDKKWDPEKKEEIETHLGYCGLIHSEPEKK